MIGGRLGHAALAGAVGGSAIACGAATGPLLATAFDVAAAAVTAGIAAHAVAVSARERGVPSAGILHRAARRAIKRSDAPLAAHAVDVLCRVRSGDSRALRSAAILLGRATTAHARGLALQLFGSWCAPLRELTQLGAPVGVARAALESAAFVRAMAGAVPAPCVTVALAPPPGTEHLRADRFPLVSLVETSGNAASDGNDESSPQSQEAWEVAA